MAKAVYTSKQAFVLSMEQLKNLCGLLTNRIAKPTITATCADGIVREYTDLKKLEKYENAIGSEIIDLSLRSSSDLEKYAKLDLQDIKSHWYAIHLNIDGDEAVVARLRSDVKAILDGTLPWYWRLAAIKEPLLFFLGAFISLFMLFLCAVAISHFDDTNWEWLGRTTIVGVCLFLTLAVSISITSTVEKLHRQYFPPAVFLIGQEISRERTRDKIRWCVVIGFVVSVAGSLVVAGALATI